MKESIERVFELLCETCRKFYYPHCNNNPECDELVAARAALAELVPIGALRTLPKEDSHGNQ